MSRDLWSDASIEPERYELHAPPELPFTLDRREFFRVLGGGLVVLGLLSEAEAQQPESGGAGRRAPGGGVPREIGAWVHVGKDGSVKAYTGKAEVGQDIRTSLSQAVAEELRVSVGSVQLVMADTALTPFDMGTFGSRTTPSMSPQLRKASAAAREALIDLAAARWGVARAGLVASDGKVSDPSMNRALGYGELTQGQKILKAIGDDVRIRPAADWDVAGRPVPKVEGRAIVTGAHRYTSDIRPPSVHGRATLLHGKVLRPPTLEAKLRSVDASKAEAMPGVVVVHDGDFVAVAAPDVATAERGLAAIRAEWNEILGPSEKDLFEDLKKPGAQGRGAGGSSGRETGSIEKGLAEAVARCEATYTVAYIAHAPLEPRAAVAEWEGDKLTVWTGTQRPFGVRTELAQALRIPDADIRVIVPDTGSGYGGKHTGEAAVEAARLARAVRQPVKLVWTREEEFTRAYFRPAGVIEAKAAAKKDGTLTVWEFHNYNSGSAGIESPYESENRRVAFHASKSPLRQGSYRALASTANHFARESLIDELAYALQVDPLAFRLKNLGDPRLKAVLEAAAERFGWGGAKLGPGRGVGIAGGTEKGGYVATCAEVAIDGATGKTSVIRVVTAFECGAIVNPDGLRNQVEGATIMGLGGALFEAVRFDAGKILNPRFSKYRVPRFADIPILEVVLLDRKDLPSAGAGEAPIITIAPAIGNALFAATGTRHRSLPMLSDGRKGGGVGVRES